MVGRDLADFNPLRLSLPPGPADVERSRRSQRSVYSISFEVRAGEIVGVAGLEGSGKNALARALIGDEPFQTGTMEIGGRAAKPRHPRAAI